MIRSMSSQFSSCASSRSSIRLAPAEKCGASLPTTSAAKFFAASRTPACSICSVSAPIAFILRVELDREHAVADVDEARAGVLLDDARAILRVAQNLQLRRGGALRRRAAAAGRTIAAATVRTPLEQLRADLARDLEHALDADRISNLERSELPSKSPSHHAIHIVGGVRDRRRHPRRIDQCRRQRLAQELADLVVAVEERPDPLADVGDRARRFERRQIGPVVCGRYSSVAGSIVRISDSPPRL